MPTSGATAEANVAMLMMIFTNSELDEDIASPAGPSSYILP
jgi:hypothetical protein